MTISKSAIVFSLIVSFVAVALLWTSGGSAQQYTGGDLGLTVRQDDLDSYWLDQRTWAFYGYRPSTKVRMTRFDPSMPTWSSGQNSYSFGINEPVGNTAAEGGPQAKFQMTKYGTWR